MMSGISVLPGGARRLWYFANNTMSLVSRLKMVAPNTKFGGGDM